MKHQQNNLDIYIRTEIEQATLPLDLEGSWNSLRKKQSNRMRAVVVVVSVIALALCSVILLQTSDKSHAQSMAEEIYSRKKLEEYENKLSSTYKEPQVCYDCNQHFINNLNKQVPADQWIMKSSNNN